MAGSAAAVADRCWMSLDERTLAVIASNGVLRSDASKALTHRVFGRSVAAAIRSAAGADPLLEAQMIDDFDRHRPTLAALPEWLDALLEAHEYWRVRDRPVSSTPRRMLVPDAFDLAARYSGRQPDPSLRASVAAAHLASRVQERGAITPATMSAVIDDPLWSAALSSLLARLADIEAAARAAPAPEPIAPTAPKSAPAPAAAAPAPDPRTPGHTLDALLALVIENVDVGARTTSVSSTGESAWAQAVECPLGPAIDRVVPLLATDGVPAHPRLARSHVPQDGTGAGSGPGSQDAVLEEFRPLDRSVRERVERMLRGDGPADYHPVLGPVGVWEKAVRSAVEPLGLDHHGSRLAMILGVRVLVAVGNDEASVSSASAGSEPTIIRSLPTGMRIAARRWRKEETIRALRAQAANASDEARRFADDPHGYFAGRLWTRVARATYSVEPVDSADTAWSHVYGALTSSAKQVSTVLRRTSPLRPSATTTAPASAAPHDTLRDAPSVIEGRTDPAAVTNSTDPVSPAEAKRLYQHVISTLSAGFTDLGDPAVDDLLTEAVRVDGRRAAPSFDDEWRALRDRWSVVLHDAYGDSSEHGRPYAFDAVFPVLLRVHDHLIGRRS